MPKIIPIRDLKDTTAISAMCHESDEPIFVTKNGYEDMVVMSAEVYDKTMIFQEINIKLDEAKKDIAEGRTRDARVALKELREEYGI